MSIVSPSIFARTSVDALSPIASHLVPESKKRFAKASEMARQARDLLQRDHAAKYLLFLFDHDLGYGVLNSFGAFLPLDEILVANPGVATNNLMPVDGHPNRKGHRIFALGLAHSIAERRLLPIDQAALAAEGPETHYTLAALVATHQPVDAAMKKLTQDFYGVAKIPSEIVLEAGKVTLPSMYRSIFGGLLPTGLLSAKTVLLLRRTGAARKLELGIEIPRLPRVEPGLFSVLIDGEERPLVPVGEPTAAVSRFDVELGPAAESELVEITLLGGGCCMGAPDDAIDGVYAVEPRWGRLRFARIR